MIALTAIVAVIFELGFSLTDADQDYYSHRPIEWIEEEPSIEDVEFEFHYRQMREQMDRMLKGTIHDD